MSRDVLKWRENLRQIDAQICQKCGKPFSDYIHNLPEGRDDFDNHEFEAALRTGGEPCQHESIMGSEYCLKCGSPL